MSWRFIWCWLTLIVLVCQLKSLPATTSMRHSSMLSSQANMSLPIVYRDRPMTFWMPPIKHPVPQQPFPALDQFASMIMLKGKEPRNAWIASLSNCNLLVQGTASLSNCNLLVQGSAALLSNCNLLVQGTGLHHKNQKTKTSITQTHIIKSYLLAFQSGSGGGAFFLTVSWRSWSM
jgi:hypothetical protein